MDALGAPQGSTRRLRVSPWKGCDHGRRSRLRPPLQGRPQPSGTPAHSRPSRGYPQSARPCDSGFSHPAVLGRVFVHLEKARRPQARSLPLVRSGQASATEPNGWILSASLCEPGEVRPFSLALCLARRGPHYRAACRRGERSRAALCFPVGDTSSRENQPSDYQDQYYFVLGARTGGRKAQLLELGSGRAPFLPLGSSEPPGAASAPAAAELPQPLTAPRELLGPGVRAPGAGRGGASARGAGRARAGARGGSARAEPSGAERSREVLGRERQAEPASRLRLSADCAASPGSAYPRLCPGSRQTFILWGSPGCLKESERSAGSALPCRGDRGDVHSLPAGLSRPAPHLLLIAPQGGDGASAERPRGRQRPPNFPAHRRRLARHNFNLISLAQSAHRSCRFAATAAVSAAASQRGAGRGGGPVHGHRRGCARRGPPCRRGRETKGKLPLFAVRAGSSRLVRLLPGSASLRPPPPAAAWPPSPRAVRAVLRDPASLRGARRCWWLGL